MSTSFLRAPIGIVSYYVGDALTVARPRSGAGSLRITTAAIRITKIPICNAPLTGRVTLPGSRITPLSIRITPLATGVMRAGRRVTLRASGVMRIESGVMRGAIFVMQTAGGVMREAIGSIDGAVVLGVRADPEPVDRAPFEQTQGSPSATDPNGIDGLFRVDSLELKAGVR